MKKRCLAMLLLALCLLTGCASLLERTAMSLSFFIFTMAISAVHYPFHYESRCVFESCLGLGAQRGFLVLGLL